MAARTISINITSDSVCPWCFVGKRRLEKAMTTFQGKHPNVTFDIQWHPYQLNPTMTAPMGKRDFYVSKFGAARAPQMQATMQAVGAAEGIAFNYDGVVSNSFDSHRLIHWAKQFNKQSEMVEQVFRLYFENANNNNLGDVNALSEAAERAGLDRNQATQFLTSENDADTVRQAVLESQRRGIHGVPHFSIDHKYTLSGAQEPDAFVEIFEELIQA
ncbi:thioredoxin-like protein [Absidia repens]|uniref:Thioredoxin-like protein n=1 Tax=Absidia repens TaxID=90262 RepID=A0A1X2HXJ3_9FUNG|nr:thioredoxin-like protein [Absidia repens]